MVLLETKQTDKQPARQQPFSDDHAEKILRKSNNWVLKDDRYQFKEGALIKKPTKVEKKPKKEEAKGDKEK